MASPVCFVGSLLKLTVLWKTQADILIKSLLKFNDDAYIYLTTEKSEVSSANSFGLDARFSAKSFI